MESVEVARAGSYFAISEESVTHSTYAGIVRFRYTIRNDDGRTIFRASTFRAVQQLLTALSLPKGN